MLTITSFYLWLKKKRLCPQPLGLSAARLGGVRRDLGRIRHSGWLSNEGGVGRKEEGDQGIASRQAASFGSSGGVWRRGQWGNRNPHCCSVFMAGVTAVAGEERGRLTAHNKTPARWKGNLNSTSRYMHRPRPAKGLTAQHEPGPCSRAHQHCPLPGGAPLDAADPSLVLHQGTCRRFSTGFIFFVRDAPLRDHAASVLYLLTRGVGPGRTHARRPITPGNLQS